MNSCLIGAHYMGVKLELALYNVITAESMLADFSFSNMTPLSDTIMFTLQLFLNPIHCFTLWMENDLHYRVLGNEDTCHV
jgi:hypothetical protein